MSNKCKFHILSIFICSMESFRVFFPVCSKHFAHFPLIPCRGTEIVYLIRLAHRPGNPATGHGCRLNWRKNTELSPETGGLLGSHFAKADLCLAGCLIFILAHSPNPLHHQARPHSTHNGIFSGWYPAAALAQSLTMAVIVWVAPPRRALLRQRDMWFNLLRLEIPIASVDKAKGTAGESVREGREGKGPCWLRRTWQIYRSQVKSPEN